MQDPSSGGGTADHTRRNQLMIVGVVVVVVLAVAIGTISSWLTKSSTTSQATATSSVKAINEKNLSTVDQTIKRATADRSTAKDVIKQTYKRIDL